MDYETFAESEEHIVLRNTYLHRNHRHISIHRHELYRLLNGDVFYPYTSWPLYIQLMFWNTPISENDTFTLLLFFYGNGCPPHIIIEFFYTSYYFKKEKIKKRFDQIKYICQNLHTKRHYWYYFDIHNNYISYLDGSYKQRDDSDQL